MILEETFTLSNGVNIPKLGLGTWRIADADVVQVVRDATKIGYRHFDTAQAYANERGVGEGLRASGIPRDNLFVTTKLAAECKTYAEAKDRIDGSLSALGLDHIDLMLIHSPQPWSEFREGASPPLSPPPSIGGRDGTSGGTASSALQLNETPHKRTCPSIEVHHDDRDNDILLICGRRQPGRPHVAAAQTGRGNPSATRRGSGDGVPLARRHRCDADRVA